MKLPIVARCKPTVEASEIERAIQLAEQIKQEIPELDPARSGFTEQMLNEPIGDAKSLHIDDFSEIPVIGVEDNSHVLQQRARLRATDGDYVVQTRKIESGYSDYCEYRLGLGRVNWLYPAVLDTDTRDIALDCWRDRRLRHDLEQAIRHEGLRYIHPHISTLQVWELAAMLQGSTRMPVQVIGPPPALAKWANDKIEFASVATRLLGKETVPQTTAAYNFATLAKVVNRLAATHSRLGIKFPDGTGGTGNFLVKSENIRGRTLKQVRNYLRQLLKAHQWPKGGRLLVDVWETEVINSPSVQTWIPPVGHGAPIIEGVFIQDVVGEKGHFAGSCPSDLPKDIEQEMVNGSFLLAKLFQSLGYVGRCSFDLILVGDSLDSCRIEFIECNARWGGTSGPMTLMNRLEATKQDQTYGIRKVAVDGLWQLEFAELTRELDDELYAPATGQGNLVIFNPARINSGSAVEVVALENSKDAVSKWLTDSLPQSLKRVVRKKTAGTHSPVGFLMGHADFDEVEN